MLIFLTKGLSGSVAVSRSTSTLARVGLGVVRAPPLVLNDENIRTGRVGGIPATIIRLEGSAAASYAFYNRRA